MIGFPQSNIFPQGTVARARYVTQNFVELKASKFLAAFKGRKFRSIYNRDKKGRQIEAPCLVSKHVGSLAVRIIGDYESTSLDLVNNAFVKVFKQLDSFAARSGAHI